MRVPLNGGPPKLEKAEVRRMMEAVYLARRLVRELSSEADKVDAQAAADTFVRLIVKKFGGDHLNPDGTVKETEERKAKDAAAPDPAKGASGP